MALAQTTLASHIFTADRRRTERNEVTIFTLAALPGQERVEIEIVNLSTGGVLVHAAQAMIENSPVHVDMPGLGWVGAKIIWYFNERHGLAFNRPLDEDYVGALAELHANA